MDGGSAEHALQRIEAALARIERAALRTAQSDVDLADRHERLRTAVHRSLSQLDELLAEHER